MTDKDILISDLNDISEILINNGYGGWYATIRKAVDLLKEQEAKPMTEYDDGWDCPRCGLKLIGKTASGYPCDEFDLPDDEIVKYCPVCGQAVKWDE